MLHTYICVYYITNETNIHRNLISLSVSSTKKNDMNSNKMRSSIRSTHSRPNIHDNTTENIKPRGGKSNKKKKNVSESEEDNEKTQTSMIQMSKEKYTIRIQNSIKPKKTSSIY